jgi:hypothetical protein
LDHIRELIVVILLIAAVYIIENVVSLPTPLGTILYVIFIILVVILLIIIILIALDYLGVNYHRH